MDPNLNPDEWEDVPATQAQAIPTESLNPDEWEDVKQEDVKPVNPERTGLQKAGRVASQFALGAAENAALPYEIGVIPVSSSSGHVQNIQHRIGEDIQQLYEKNSDAFGNVKPVEKWSKQDQDFLKHFSERIKDPKITEAENAENVPRPIGIRGLTERATGLDLHPEGFLEKAAGWLGFLKDPRKGFEATKFILDGFKTGAANVTGKEVAKAILPGTKTLRAASAGEALQLAEEGKFGPTGSILVATAADILGHGPRAAYNIAKNPKQAAANTINFLTQNNTKKQWATQLIEDAKNSGIQLDAGTLTDSSIVKFLQAKAAQSGLSGEAFRTFQKDTSGQVLREYGKILEEVGNSAFENTYQASEAVKNALKVEETKLNTIAEQGNVKKRAESSPSLQGRIATQAQPNLEQNLLNRIAPEENITTSEKGQHLKNTVEEIRQPIKENFNERYTNITQELAHIPDAPHGVLAEEMANFVERHEGSLLPGISGPETAVLEAARLLRDRLRTADGALHSVSITDLIKTKRSLADVADWEFGGSNFKSAYKKLVADIDEAIERQIHFNEPDLLTTYQELNSEYANYKNVFENKNVKQLFEPKNNNFNAIYDSYVTNPDKLAALEHILESSPQGQSRLNQVKRDYARNVIEKNTVTPQELTDLRGSLGHPFTGNVIDYAAARAERAANPNPRVARPNPRGQQIQGPSTERPSGSTVVGSQGPRKVKETPASIQNKMYQLLKDKKPEEILKLMDTLGGIKKIRRALEQTPEGKELFKELSRYKLDEMITKKMQDSVSEQVKLGKFAGILETSTNREIAKELLGESTYNKLVLLQKNSGRLGESAYKFLNVSQSGSTLADVFLMGEISAGVVGALTGNPFLLMPAVAHVGGMRVFGYLMSDKTFLKYLEEAIVTNNPKKFQAALEKMRPSVEAAIKQNTLSQQEE